MAGLEWQRWCRVGGVWWVVWLPRPSLLRRVATCKKNNSSANFSSPSSLKDVFLQYNTDEQAHIRMLQRQRHRAKYGSRLKTLKMRAINIKATVSRERRLKINFICTLYEQCTTSGRLNIFERCYFVWIWNFLILWQYLGFSFGPGPTYITCCYIA